MIDDIKFDIAEAECREATLAGAWFTRRHIDNHHSPVHVGVHSAEQYTTAYIDPPRWLPRRCMVTNCFAHQDHRHSLVYYLNSNLFQFTTDPRTITKIYHQDQPPEHITASSKIIHHLASPVGPNGSFAPRLPQTHKSCFDACYAPHLCTSCAHKLCR